MRKGLELWREKLKKIKLATPMSSLSGNFPPTDVLRNTHISLIWRGQDSGVNIAAKNILEVAIRFFMFSARFCSGGIFAGSISK